VSGYYVEAAFFELIIPELSFLQAAGKPPLPSESSPKYADLEETAKKERQRIEELLRSKGMTRGSYPRFTVGVKGQKVIAFISLEVTVLNMVHLVASVWYYFTCNSI
jgi:hypothetical protein